MRDLVQNWNLVQYLKAVNSHLKLNGFLIILIKFHSLFQIIYAPPYSTARPPIKQSTSGLHNYRYGTVAVLR